MEKLIITRPDDAHLHVRDGAMLKMVLPHTVKQFARAVIMPNLKPPVTTVAKAMRYRAEILQAIPARANFTPLMTLYLTPTTTLQDVQQASENPHIVAFKYYPAGATTNSDAGIASLQMMYPVLDAMQNYALPLLIHGEVTDAACDIFDREQMFVDTQLKAIVRDFPQLRIVLEHVTTEGAVQFVRDSGANIAATITPQHLLYNRNAMLVGGIKPHYYCLPILKREQHRLALVEAAISGNPKFFLGTDSAPHLTTLKENACGCAGCFSAHAALELYAEVFEANNALDKLEGFASFYAADFYGLPRNIEKVTLIKSQWTVPESYNLQVTCDLEVTSGEADCKITPLRAGESIGWKLASEE